MLLARSALECGTLVPLSASHLADAHGGPTRAGNELPAAKAGASSCTPRVAASNIDTFCRYSAAKRLTFRWT
jgi:hypothetical protein